MPRVSRSCTPKNPHCSMAMSAEHRSKFVALHGNGDVSIWVKNSRVGRKTLNKQSIRLQLLIFNRYLFLEKYERYKENNSNESFYLQDKCKLKIL